MKIKGISNHLIHAEITYRCLDCGYEHKPNSIEFYNVCPRCKHKSSIPKGGRIDYD